MGHLGLFESIQQRIIIFCVRQDLLVILGMVISSDVKSGHLITDCQKLLKLFDQIQSKNWHSFSIEFLLFYPIHINFITLYIFHVLRMPVLQLSKKLKDKRVILSGPLVFDYNSICEKSDSSRNRIQYIFRSLRSNVVCSFSENFKMKLWNFNRIISQWISLFTLFLCLSLRAQISRGTQVGPASANQRPVFHNLTNQRPEYRDTESHRGLTMHIG